MSEDDVGEEDIEKEVGVNSSGTHVRFSIPKASSVHGGAPQLRAEAHCCLSLGASMAAALPLPLLDMFAALRDWDGGGSVPAAPGARRLLSSSFSDLQSLPSCNIFSGVPAILGSNLSSWFSVPPI